MSVRESHRLLVRYLAAYRFPQVGLDQVGQHVHKGDQAYHPIDLFSVVPIEVECHGFCLPILSIDTAVSLR